MSSDRFRNALQALVFREVMDLGAVAHLATIKGRVPVLHFFDGFRTSHEIQKIEMWDYDDLADMVDYEAIDKFRAECLNPEHPVLRWISSEPRHLLPGKRSS